MATHKLNPSTWVKTQPGGNLFQKRGFSIDWVLAEPPPLQATGDVKRWPPRVKANGCELTKWRDSCEDFPSDSNFTRPCGEYDVVVILRHSWESPTEIITAKTAATAVAFFRKSRRW